MKKKDSKKSKKKKKNQKQAESPELSQLKELTDTVKTMAKELTKLQKTNKSLRSEIKKIKKKNKNEETPEVVTKVMEPQVLPPSKPKRTRKLSTSKSALPKSAPAAKTAAKPGPKPGRRNAAKKASAPNRPAGPEDLRFIRGLGAKIESLMIGKGIKSFADLAKASQARIKGILEQAGPRFKNQDPKPLIEQAKLVKAAKWSDLENLQAELSKGKGKPGPKK